MSFTDLVSKEKEVANEIANKPTFKFKIVRNCYKKTVNMDGKARNINGEIINVPTPYEYYMMTYSLILSSSDGRDSVVGTSMEMFNNMGEPSITLDLFPLKEVDLEVFEEGTLLGKSNLQPGTDKIPSILDAKHT